MSQLLSLTNPLFVWTKLLCCVISQTYWLHWHVSWSSNAPVFGYCRVTDFPRSRKTDGKRGIGILKRKIQFQTENRGKPLFSGKKNKTHKIYNIASANLIHLHYKFTKKTNLKLNKLTWTLCCDFVVQLHYTLQCHACPIFLHCAIRERKTQTFAF